MPAKYPILVFIILGTLPLYSCAKSANSEVCSTWISNLHTKIVQSPPNERLKTIIRSIGDTSCQVIPQDIRDAAAKTKISSKKNRATTLGKAAKAHLPANCHMNNYLDTAVSLTKNCRLLQLENISESLLRFLDAGSYAFMWVLQQSLIEVKLHQGKSATDMERVFNYMLIATATANE